MLEGYSFGQCIDALRDGYVSYKLKNKWEWDNDRIKDAVEWVRSDIKDMLKNGVDKDDIMDASSRSRLYSRLCSSITQRLNKDRIDKLLYLGIESVFQAGPDEYLQSSYLPGCYDKLEPSLLRMFQRSGYWTTEQIQDTINAIKDKIIRGGTTNKNNLDVHQQICIGIENVLQGYSPAQCMQALEDGSILKRARLYWTTEQIQNAVEDVKDKVIRGEVPNKNILGAHPLLCLGIENVLQGYSPAQSMQALEDGSILKLFQQGNYWRIEQIQNAIDAVKDVINMLNDDMEGIMEEATNEDTLSAPPSRLCSKTQSSNKDRIDPLLYLGIEEADLEKYYLQVATRCSVDFSFLARLQRIGYWTTEQIQNATDAINMLKNGTDDIMDAPSRSSNKDRMDSLLLIGIYAMFEAIPHRSIELLDNGSALEIFQSIGYWTTEQIQNALDDVRDLFIRINSFMTRKNDIMDAPSRSSNKDRMDLLLFLGINIIHQDCLNVGALEYVLEVLQSVGYWTTEQIQNATDTVKDVMNMLHEIEFVSQIAVNACAFGVLPSKSRPKMV